jgi:hypothetical protein
VLGFVFVTDALGHLVSPGSLKNQLLLNCGCWY